MTSLRLSAIGVALLCNMFSLICLAQGKHPVAVAHTGVDYVGKLLAHEVNKQIRNSDIFKPADGYDAFTVNLATVNPEVPDNEQGKLAKYCFGSVVLTMANFTPDADGEPHTWWPTYLGAKIFMAGKENVEDHAITILLDLEKIRDKYSLESRQE
jgi:hypothetical protein